MYQYMYIYDVTIEVFKYDIVSWLTNYHNNDEKLFKEEYLLTLKKKSVKCIPFSNVLINATVFIHNQIGSLN